MSDKTRVYFIVLIGFLILLGLEIVGVLDYVAQVMPMYYHTL